MNILLILAIFWPALAGLVIFLTPGCKENKQLRGRAVNAALAVELAKRQITVNCVAPGVIETEMTEDLPVDEILRAIPLRRFGRPEEVAAAVGYLMSDDAAYVTRQVLQVNGGLCG